MKNLVVSIAALLALSLPILAQNHSAAEQNKVGADDAPLPGAGLPVFAIVVIGGVVYWLMRRRRAKKD